MTEKNIFVTQLKYCVCLNVIKGKKKKPRRLRGTSEKNMKFT